MHELSYNKYLFIHRNICYFKLCYDSMSCLYSSKCSYEVHKLEPHPPIVVISASGALGGSGGKSIGFLDEKTEESWSVSWFDCFPCGGCWPTATATKRGRRAPIPPPRSIRAELVVTICRLLYMVKVKERPKDAEELDNNNIRLPIPGFRYVPIGCARVQN